MSDFREKTMSAATWSMMSQVGRQSMLLITNIVLARLLTPRDFGLIATSLIFINFSVIIAEQGFGAALIQRKEISEDHLSSTFWINLLVGAVICGLLWLIAPIIAGLYEEAHLTALMRLISLIFLINPLSMIPATLLTRRLDFRRLAKAEVLSAWLGGAAAIVLALAGLGVWSIAWQSVIAAFANVAILWRVCDWRPKLQFKKKAAAQLANLSTNLFLTNALEYWVRTVDNVLIGLFLGQHSLGVYSRAYSVMLFPLSRVSWMLSRVMFPSLAQIQGDPARVRDVFLKMTRVLAVVTFPMMLGVAAAAAPFVACVFGPQWTEMAPTLRVLACVGMLQSVTAMIHNLYLAHDKMALSLRVALPCQALQIAGIVIGLHWGILGVAVGYAVASVLIAPVDCYFAGRLIGMSVADFAANLSGVFGCASLMAAAVALAQALMPAGTPAALALALDIGLGAIVYFAALQVFGVTGFLEFKRVAAERLKALGWSAA